MWCPGANRNLDVEAAKRLPLLPGRCATRIIACFAKVLRDEPECGGAPKRPGLLLPERGDGARGSGEFEDVHTGTGTVDYDAERFRLDVMATGAAQGTLVYTRDADGSLRVIGDYAGEAVDLSG